ncbi:hypothetical protein [Cyanobacterium sp. Dongsha4]|uniref:hypothetical protein n=1 Tax=Cyanobacterium sp. DS4 TaxID=2878255 RepID=UPI002E8022D7|nr:hypothetical protein [Cyanobacterium sp. Dongsha4]WVL00702.1 hypothetical protein Dongsha4_00445 [Cyanobacterium sp. Dongsha4]
MNYQNQTLNLNDLKSEQIAYLQDIIEKFKQQNHQEASNCNISETIEMSNFDDIFFESEILQPFNRRILYGNRS